MYVCVAGNGEMLVYFSFFPNNSLNIGFEPYGVIFWPQAVYIMVLCERCGGLLVIVV